MKTKLDTKNKYKYIFLLDLMEYLNILWSTVDVRLQFIQHSEYVGNFIMFVKLTFPTFQYNMGRRGNRYFVVFRFCFLVFFFNQSLTDEKRDVTIYYPLRDRISYTHKKKHLNFFKKEGRTKRRE